MVGDKLYFYVGAASGRIKPPDADPANIGLAILRRDGFTSMDAGEQEGTLTTRKLKFNKGDYSAMIKDPRMAGPFIKSFAVMGQVKAAELA